MRHLRASTIPTAFLLACASAALAGCAEDADDFSTSSGDDGMPIEGNDSSEPIEGNDDSSGPPPTEECTFTYRNSIKDNGYEVDVWLIYLFPAGSSEIGDDLLGSNVLPYGFELEVSGVPEGRYDTMVVDEDAYYYIESGVECDGSDWTWTITVGDVDGQLDVSGTDEELDLIAEEAWPLADSVKIPARTRRAM